MTTLSASASSTGTTLSPVSTRQIRSARSGVILWRKQLNEPRQRLIAPRRGDGLGHHE